MASPTLSVLPSGSPCGSPGKKATFAVFVAVRQVQGREIRRNFSKTYADLLWHVMAWQVNGQMVEFRAVNFQKSTISSGNIRLTCSDAGK